MDCILIYHAKIQPKQDLHQIENAVGIVNAWNNIKECQKRQQNNLRNPSGNLLKSSGKSNKPRAGLS